MTLIKKVFTVSTVKPFFPEQNILGITPVS